VKRHYRKLESTCPLTRTAYAIFSILVSDNRVTKGPVSSIFAYPDGSVWLLSYGWSEQDWNVGG